MMRKSLLLASAVLFTAACGDDDKSPVESTDGGLDASTRDATLGTLDAGNIDAAAQDASPATDAGSSDAAQQAPIEIVGVWNDDTYVGSGDLEITSAMFGSWTIVEYDNASRTAYTKYPADDAYTPNKYAKQVWLPIANGGFYQCTQEYAADTLAAAKASTMKADPSNVTVEGCGDFNAPWSHFIPAIEIRGEWRSGGEDLHVDSDAFADYAIQSYDNAANQAVLSLGGGDAGLLVFKKLVWSAVDANSLHYCILGASFTTQAEAEASSATADSTELSTGCNGAAWSALTK